MGKKFKKNWIYRGPILETPDTFNEIEGLVRSNYLDHDLLEKRE